MAKNWLKQYAQNGKNISFEEYYKQVPKSKNDTSGYDLRTFYANNPEEAWKFANSAEGHAPDTYKKPNHITFSNESIYATPDNPGGKWGFENNQDVFYATPQNVKNAGGVNKLKKYFQDQEKNVKLVLPKKQNGGTIGNWWDELTKAKYGQNMLNMTDEQIAMVRDVNRVTDDPLMIPGSPRVKAQSGTKVSSKGYKKNSPDKNEPMLTIPSNRITMQDVEHPVMAYPSAGNPTFMHPGGEYYFPHADYVTEVPVAQNGWSSSDLAKLRQAVANYNPAPYQDMDPAMLQPYQQMQHNMQLAATPQGRVQLKKEASDKKYANKKKQEVAKDKQTGKDLQEQYARDRFNADPSVINPAYWQTDPQTGRTPQQRLDDMGTDLQTRVFRGGTETLDNLNPGVWVAGMAGNLAKAPLRAQQENSYTPYLSALGEPLAWGAGEELIAPYIKNIFGKKPVVYGESNVAPHDPYSSVADNWQSVTRGPVIAHEPFSEPYPNEPGYIEPAKGKMAATLTKVTPLTKEQKILHSYGLDVNSPGKISNNFKSEIDWAKWNKEIPGNKPLMDEYYAIEQTSKANGTWMKNPDGSTFPGTPEQFVQQNSENFKKAFGNTKVLVNGRPQILTHNSPNKFDAFTLDNKNVGRLSGDGIYTFEEGIARDNLPEHMKKSFRYPAKIAQDQYGDIEYNLYGNSNNPKIGKGQFDDITPDQILANPTSTRIIDDINGQNIHVFPDPLQLKSAIGNNGMFDMSNPNIYKSLLPITLGIGAAAMSQQDTKQYGGKLTKNWLQNY